MLGSRFRVGVAATCTTFGCSVLTSVDGLVPNDASLDSAPLDASATSKSG